MRIVIDTNVLVSFLFWKNDTITAVISEVLKSHQLLISTEIFAELSEVMLRKRFDDYLDLEERELFLAFIQEKAEHVLIKQRVDLCRDKQDNKFLELAVNGDAHVIVTGDKDLLVLDPFKTTRIAEPKEFLSLVA